MNVGTIVTMPLTGLLTKYGFDGGWASVFYCFGKKSFVVTSMVYDSSHVIKEPTSERSELEYCVNNEFINT